MLYATLLIWSATAGTLLGNGLALGNTALIIAGATMSLICPWGIITVAVHDKIRRQRRHRNHHIP